MDNLKSKYLLIDSANRLSYSNSSTDFYFKFTQGVEITSYVKLIYCMIPNSQYLIEENVNDTFIINVNSTDYAITINQGDYSALDLCENLKTSINQNQDLTDINFSCDFNNKRSHYLFSADSDFTITFYNNLQKILGFSQNINESNANNLESDQYVYFIGTRYINIYIDQLNVNNQILSNQNINSTFFIPMLTDRRSVNIFNELSNYVNKLEITNKILLDTIRITIYDENNKVINLNNLPITLLLLYN